MTDNNSNQTDEYGQVLSQAGSQATLGCGIWVLGGLGLALALAGLGHAAATFLKFTADDGHWWLHIGPGLLLLVAAGMLLHLARQLSRAPPSTSDEHQGEDTLDKLRERQQSSGQVTGVASMLKQVKVWASILVMAALALIMTVAVSTELADSTAARWIMTIAVIMALSFAHNATREARQTRERGASRLSIDNPPVRAGERLTGHISIDLGPEPEQIRLDLICENISYPTPSPWQKERLASNSSYRNEFYRFKNRTITRLFETGHSFKPSQLEPEGNNRWQIPVAFDIPLDSTPTDRRERYNYTFWRLNLKAHCADGETRQDAWEVQVIQPDSDDESTQDR
jgi:hypothetical protein